MRDFQLLVAIAALGFLPLSNSRGGIFYPIDITDVADFTWGAPDAPPGEPVATRLPGAPTGMTNLLGVPFDIASNASGKQAWHGDVAAAGNPGLISFTETVNLYGVTNVYSLVNTWEGQPGPTAYAWFVFRGSAGAVYTNQLVGGFNLRDYNGAYWENDISDPNTVNIFACDSDNWGSNGRLDRQSMALPAAFATQTLVSVELVDNGGPGVQRVVLDGLTAEGVAPSLSIAPAAGNISVSWPLATGWTLQTNDDLSVNNWTDYGGSVSSAEGTNSIALASPTRNLFFRLRH